MQTQVGTQLRSLEFNLTTCIITCFGILVVGLGNISFMRQILGGLEQLHLCLLADMKKAPKLVVITAEFEGRVAVFVEDFEPSR
jgi:hypothetical protein